MHTQISNETGTDVKHEAYMRIAIEAAEEGIMHGQTPFGACIVKNGEVISSGHNQVWGATDITAHAEIRVIREACRKLGTVDLSGCVIYSTCEPCPMCFSACHWANISKIYYGAVIEDAKRAGFRELTISNEEMKELGNSPIDLEGGILQEDCTALFDKWLASGEARTY